MFDRRLYTHLDWSLLAAVFALCLLGLGMIYSTTYEAATGSVGPQLARQLWALALGVVAMVVCLGIDYRLLSNRVALIYGGLALLLACALVIGSEQGGARRWIDLGPVNVQPSEFARMAVALALATFYGTSQRATARGLDWVVGGLVVAAPFLLILVQPDLGTAVTLLPVCLAIMVFAGLRLKLLAAFALVGLLLSPVAWTYALEDYQRTRLASFIDPERDPRGAGYQQIQARITVGSGGVTGKGFLQGTQSQYNFLPVAHSDFVFSVLAEEQGFRGVLVVLGLYLFVIMRSLEAARVARDRTGLFLVVGITAGFSFQVIYNLTMSAGLAPVKGLTLPLMSYGGSSLIATLMGFGLILNVGMRRFAS